MMSGESHDTGCVATLARRHGDWGVSSWVGCLGPKLGFIPHWLDDLGQVPRVCELQLLHLRNMSDNIHSSHLLVLLKNEMGWFKCLAHHKHSVDVVIIYKGLLALRVITCQGSRLLYLDDHDSTISRRNGVNALGFREPCVSTLWLQTLAMPCPQALDILLHELKAIYQALCDSAWESVACSVFRAG